MAFSTQNYTGDGTQMDWAVTFDYLDRDHVSVRVNKVLTTDVGSAYDFTWVNDTTVRITAISGGTPVPLGVSIELVRQTPIDVPAVVFGSGASLPTEDLNRNSEFLTFALQEATDDNEEFTKLYLGAFDSDPTTDNEGGPLRDGAMYLNSAENRFYGYTAVNGWVGAGGQKGDPGNDGQDGQDGQDGADGLGVPAGGAAGQILGKASNADNDTAWVDPPADGQDGADGNDGNDGADGVGVPAGGNEGQVLLKSTNTDYDTEWADFIGQPFEVGDVTAYLDDTTVYQTSLNTFQEFFHYVFVQEGTVRVKYDHRRINGAASEVRIFRNGVQLDEQSTTSGTPVSRSFDVAVVYGDILTLEHRNTDPDADRSEVTNVQLATNGEDLYPHIIDRRFKIG